MTNSSGTNLDSRQAGPEGADSRDGVRNDIRIQKTGEPDILQTSDGRLPLSVPIQIKRRSGRKLVTLPNGETAPVRPWDVTATPFQLALAKGASLAGHAGVGGSEITEGDRRAEGDRQQLREPDGQPDHAGAGYRCGDPGRCAAEPHHVVRPGG